MDMDYGSRSKKGLQFRSVKQIEAGESKTWMSVTFSFEEAIAKPKVLSWNMW